MEGQEWCSIWEYVKIIPLTNKRLSVMLADVIIIDKRE
jgi:hypothetical protein